MPRILIIDDDESIRRMLRFRLKNSYELLEASTPEQGLLTAIQSKPDAILVDLMMPAHSGFEICQTLSGLSFTEMIPVFVISGAPKAMYQDYCDMLGAVGYFEKPLNFDELQARLAEAVARSRENRRAEPRIHLRIGLKLRGTDAKGSPFESMLFTENVSRGGFACGLPVSLAANATVEVFLWIPAAHRFAGEARLAWTKYADTPAQICGFQFLGEPREWLF